VRFCPGIQGGVEWNGAAFSPDSNSLFVDWCANVQLKRELEVPSAGGLWLGAETPFADIGKILWQSNAGQSTGGGIVTYRAGGRQLIGVASGMKSPVWPGGAQ